MHTKRMHSIGIYYLSVEGFFAEAPHLKGEEV
jgi:hypothetical protein